MFRSTGSDNDRPDIFPESQLHIVLEFEYAGQELESYVFNNALQTYSVFLQVCFKGHCLDQVLTRFYTAVAWHEFAVLVCTVYIK